MYRILEHLVGRLKNRRIHLDSITEIFHTPGPSTSQILDLLSARHAALPAVYRSTRIMTGDNKVDRLSFQAANIAITYQTVKLALAGAEDQSVTRSCEIAGELLDVLASIPTSYIVAISTPMVRRLTWNPLIDSCITSRVAVICWQMLYKALCTSGR